MRARTIAWTFVMCLVGLTFAFADNPQLGTWKLDEAKSKLPPSMPRNTTVVYEAAGDQIKVTIDGVDAKGAATHNEWTGKFDGKDYPVTGDSTSDTRSYKKVNDHTLEFDAKKAGKTTLSGKITVSADGKTRSVTATGMGPDGKKVTGTVVYDKQ
jgi:hypothetical protein